MKKKGKKKKSSIYARAMPPRPKKMALIRNTYITLIDIVI